MSDLHGTARDGNPHAGGTSASEPGQDATEDEIVADIEETREHLQDTVDALASKLDVKANTKARIDQTTQSVTDKVSEVGQNARDTYGRALQSQPVARARARPAVPAGVAVAVVLVGVVLVWRSRR